VQELHESTPARIAETAAIDRNPWAVSKRSGGR
jgi:hypothetical protein